MGGPATYLLGGYRLIEVRTIVAKRKTLFDDRPVEINELTYVIKQDLSSLNSQISSLQSLSKSQQSQSSRGGAEQEGEHNKNVRPVSEIENLASVTVHRSSYSYKASSPTWGRVSKTSSKSERKTYKPPDHAPKTSSPQYPPIRNHR